MSAQAPFWCAGYVNGSLFADHGRGEAHHVFGTRATRKFDCWGLVRAVLEEIFGISGLPDYGECYAGARDQATVSKAMRDGLQTGGWQKIDLGSDQRPVQPGDLIILRLAGRPWHCGIVVAKELFLHITEGAGATIENWTGPVWRNRVEGFYRKLRGSEASQLRS